MTDVSDRIQYAVLSAFLGGCIAMAITFWTDASFDLHFFGLFMGPAAIAGFLVGQPFYEALGQILHRIW